MPESSNFNSKITLNKTVANEMYYQWRESVSSNNNNNNNDNNNKETDILLSVEPWAAAKKTF